MNHLKRVLWALPLLWVFHFPPKSWAQTGPVLNFWPGETEDLFSHFPNIIQDAFLFTLWGVCHAPQVTAEDLRAQAVELKLRSAKLTQGDLRFMLYRHQDRRPRPLVIFVPGVFGNLEDARGLRIIKTLLTKANVLFLPNPLGLDYLSKGPKHDMGDVEREAELLRLAIAQGLSDLRRLGINSTRVDLMGLSYGAFISSVISAQDAQSGAPMITGTVTLLSPPYQLFESMRALDSLMDQYDRYFEYFPAVKYARYMAKFCLAPNFPVWRDEELDIARYLTGHMGFHDGLVKAINIYEEVWDKDAWFKPLGMASYFYRQWYREQRFVKYVSENFPQTARKLQGPVGEISYWMDQSWARGKQVRVVTCRDDFINPSPEWQNVSDIKVIDHCGHFGMQGLPWLDQLLTSLI